VLFVIIPAWQTALETNEVIRVRVLLENLLLEAERANI
jgi:hypothetical protein